MIKELMLGTMLCAGPLSAAELIYGTDAKDSLGRSVRILEVIREDGSGRRALLSRDFSGENFWPGYRGVGPGQYDTADVASDGRTVLFTNTYNIFATDLSGGTIYDLTRFTREKYYPRWSPDGKQIAFVSDRNDNCEIYVMNADGSGIQNISWNKSSNLSPSWSPNGKEIAFIRKTGDFYQLYISDSQGIRQKKVLSLDGDIREPDWGNNGRILFSFLAKDGSSRIMSVKPDGKDVQTHLHSKAWSGQAVWSADCSKIAFSSTRSGNADIWICDLKTNKFFNVTNSPLAQDYFPRFIPEKKSASPMQWKKDLAILQAEKCPLEGRDGVHPVLACPVEIKEKPLPRPRMLFTAEELPQIRKRLSKEPYQTWWKKMLAECNRDLKAGRVEKSLEEIPSDPLRKRYSIPAFADLYYKGYWATSLMNLAFAWQVTGEKKYGERAVEILLKAAQQYRKSFGVMYCNYPLACAYDWIHSLIPAKELSGLNSLLKLSLDGKINTCLNYFSGIYGSSPGCGNYSIYFSGSLGPMALALAGEDGIDEYPLSVAQRLALLTLNRWIAPEGDAEEGFSYFNHPVSELMPFLISLRKNGRGAELENSNLKHVAKWFACSSLRGGQETPAIGDADYLPLLMPAGLLYLYKDDVLLRKLWNSVPRSPGEMRNVMGLLFWEPSEAKLQDLGELPAGCVFPHIGYAVLRTGSAVKDTVVTISAPQSSGHAHLEYGAITLSGRNKRFLSDPGQAVGMADYHSQLIINGAGRERCSIAEPMIQGPFFSKSAVNIAVDFTRAFDLMYFGYPGYSGIPCGRAGILNGKRLITMVPASDGVPAYFLVYDLAQTAQKSLFEQLFTTDQGMRIVQEKDGSMRVEEAIQETTFRGEFRKPVAEWNFNMEKTGKFYVQIYAKDQSPVLLEVNGKSFYLNYQQPPTRANTWQWRSLQEKRKPFIVELPAGKNQISLSSFAQIYALGFSAEKDISGELPENGTALMLKITDAVRIRSWKEIPPDRDFLRIVPMTGKPETAQTRKNFTTRFHGQLPVTLPQGKFRMNGTKGEFLTLLYLSSPNEDQAKVLSGYRLQWKNAQDEIHVGPLGITVKRKTGKMAEK